MRSVQVLNGDGSSLRVRIYDLDDALDGWDERTIGVDWRRSPDEPWQVLLVTAVDDVATVPNEWLAP